MNLEEVKKKLEESPELVEDFEKLIEASMKSRAMVGETIKGRDESLKQVLLTLGDELSMIRGRLYTERGVIVEQSEGLFASLGFTGCPDGDFQGHKHSDNKVGDNVMSMLDICLLIVRDIRDMVDQNEEYMRKVFLMLDGRINITKDS